MIYRHTDEQIQDYFDSPAINQSGLKIIIDSKKGIEYFADNMQQLLGQEDLYYEEKTHFIIGNGVDCIISQGIENFKNKYYYSNLVKKPSDAVKSIINMVFDRVISQGVTVEEILPFISYKQEIYEAANEHAYFPKRAAPTEKQLKDEDEACKKALAKGEVCNKKTPQEWVLEDNRWTSMKNAEEYWQNLKEANGKQVLSDYEYNTINKIVLSFTTHRFTKELFKDSEDIDIVYQMPIFWTYLGEDCKGMLDHIIIDHKAKRIKPIDEKTMGDYITRFGNACKIRRYDLQGSFYQYGLSQNLEYLSNILNKDVTEYTIAPFAFIAESTIKSGVPLIFPMTEELSRNGLEGDGRYTLGWFQAMQIYKEWKAMNYSVEEKYDKTNGIVWLDGNYQLKEPV